MVKYSPAITMWVYGPMEHESFIYGVTFVVCHCIIMKVLHWIIKIGYSYIRADSRLASSQRETSLQSSTHTHWLWTNLQSWCIGSFFGFTFLSHVLQKSIETPDLKFCTYPYISCLASHHSIRSNIAAACAKLRPDWINNLLVRNALIFFTRWGRNKMTAISQTTFQQHFLEWKCMDFD